MAMSRKHYREAAETLAAQHANATTPETIAAVESITRDLADMFKRDNGHFDRQRFYDAARLGEREVTYALQAVS